MKKKPTIAFMYDFDKTLCDQDTEGIFSINDEEKRVKVEKINGETTFHDVKELEGGYAHHLGRWNKSFRKNNLLWYNKVGLPTTNKSHRRISHD